MWSHELTAKANTTRLNMLFSEQQNNNLTCADLSADNHCENEYRKTRQHLRLIRLSVWRLRYRQLFSIPTSLLQFRNSILQWKPKLRNAWGQ